MPEITPTPPRVRLAPEPAVAMHELPGWMVLGILTEASAVHPRSVPVLAPTASAAMALAAARHADFQPVGILSEEELLNHLKTIAQHRTAFASGA